MIFRDLLAWTQSAPSASRIEAARALARAWLETDLSDEDRADAEVALTSFLDDPAVSVRRALSVELAAAWNAPRHVMYALACDLSEVSVPVLSRSRLLSDAELSDCVAIGDVYAQAAIALRPDIGPAASAAIGEYGVREAVISLAVNPGACLNGALLSKILNRFAEDGEVREAVLSRTSLPANVRSDLVDATASALGSFVTACGWMTPERVGRVCHEAQDAAYVEIAAETGARATVNVQELVRHLRQKNQLTAGLLIRALLSGNRGLIEAALAELSGMPVEKTAAFVKAWSGAGFAALFTRAGLPAGLLPVFRATLAAQDEYGLIYAAGQRPQLSRLLIGKALQSLETMQAPNLGHVIALLQRLRAEAARAEARHYSMMLKAPTLPAPGGSAIEIDMAALEHDVVVAA